MLGGVDDAEAGRGHGLEAGRADGLPAHLAVAVGPRLADRCEGRLDLVERLPQSVARRSASPRSAVTWLESAKLES